MHGAYTMMSPVNLPPIWTFYITYARSWEDILRGSFYGFQSAWPRGILTLPELGILGSLYDILAMNIFHFLTLANHVVNGKELKPSQMSCSHIQSKESFK